jgi:cytidine deaminase
MVIPENIVEALKQRARKAAAHAYAPYSGFAVGAAVLVEDGTMHSSANVENASFGLSNCAERNAVFLAVAQGARRIEALAIYTDTPTATTPCGACRQVLAEFGAGAMVICFAADASSERRYTLQQLLPDAFGPASL